MFIACKSCPPWIYFAQASRTALRTYGLFSASDSCVHIHTHLASHYILGHVEVNRNAHTDNYISCSIWSKIQEVFSSGTNTSHLGKRKIMFKGVLVGDMWSFPGVQGACAICFRSGNNVKSQDNTTHLWYIVYFPWTKFTHSERIAKRCYSRQNSNGFLLMIRVIACLPGQ